MYACVINTQTGRSVMLMSGPKLPKTLELLHTHLPQPTNTRSTGVLHSRGMSKRGYTN